MNKHILLVLAIAFILLGVYGLQFIDDRQIEKYQVLNKDTGEYTTKYREVKNPSVILSYSLSVACALIIAYIFYIYYEKQKRLE